MSEELTKLYSFDLFWHRRQKLHGHPPIEQRPDNDRSDGRIDYWLALIAKYGPPEGTVVEVGPGHGALLAELQTKGFEVLGVEPDVITCKWIEDTMGVPMVSGLFPAVELPTGIDLFLAFDVLEHAADPLTFVQGAADLVRSGGTIIFQCPIDRYDMQPPFGEAGFRQMFDDVEHLFIFTDESIRLLAERSGLKIVSLDERLWLHHEIAVLVKP